MSRFWFSMLHRLSNEYYLNIKEQNQHPNQKTTQPSGPPTEEKLRQASEIGIIKGSLQLTSAF